MATKIDAPAAKALVEAHVNAASHNKALVAVVHLADLFTDPDGREVWRVTFAKRYRDGRPIDSHGSLLVDAETGAIRRDDFFWLSVQKDV